jgi:hypothetical protein
MLGILLVFYELLIIRKLDLLFGIQDSGFGNTAGNFVTKNQSDS